MDVPGGGRGVPAKPSKTVQNPRGGPKVTVFDPFWGSADKRAFWNANLGHFGPIFDPFLMILGVPPLPRVLEIGYPLPPQNLSIPGDPSRISPPYIFSGA